MLTRALAFMVLQPLNDSVRRYQFGLMKFGFDIAVHSARAWRSKMAEDKKAAGKFDLKNAFNATLRQMAIDCVYAFFPEMAPVVFWLYRHESELVLDDGSTIQSCQGVQQGDPLAGLLFVLVVHFVASVLTMRNNFRAERGLPTWDRQAWYFDDVTAVSYTHLTLPTKRIV